MKVNFIIEDMGKFKYIGCSTVAKEIQQSIQNLEDIEWNGKKSKYDIYHFHTFGPIALLKRRFSKGINILTAHSLPSINVGNIIGSKNFWDKIYKWIYNKFDYIVAVSETSKEEIHSLGINKPISVIYNGVNLEKFKFSKEKRQDFRKKYNLDDKFVILNVGQKTPRKGFYDFCALEKKGIKDAVYIWVGGKPYGGLSQDARKINLIEKNASDTLRFPGFIHDITEAYSGADLLFAPTQGETFGLTQLEALSCNLPVLTRDLPVLNEIYKDTILTGISIEDFEAKIRLLIQDEKLRKQYSNHRKYVEENFDISDIGKKHISLYNELLNRTNG